MKPADDGFTAEETVPVCVRSGSNATSSRLRVVCPQHPRRRGLEDTVLTMLLLRLSKELKDHVAEIAKKIPKVSNIHPEKKNSVTVSAESSVRECFAGASSYWRGRTGMTCLYGMVQVK